MDQRKPRSGILDDVPAFNPIPSYLGAFADAMRGENVGSQLNQINAQQMQDSFRRYQLSRQAQQEQAAAAQAAAQAAESRRRFELQHGLAKRRLDMASNQGPRVMNVGGTLVRVGADGKPEVLYQPSGDPLDRQIKQERLRKLQRGDPLADMKTRILGQILGGEQQPAQQGGVQLQSDEVTATDPRLIQAQTAEGQAQQQPASPLDNLTPEQRQGMALNLVSPGLGKALLESSRQSNYEKPAINRLETGIVNSEEGYARLQNIARNFKPEFLTVQGNIKGSWLNFLDKIRSGSQPLDQTQQKYLEEYSTFKQDAWDNANRYIKEITGAQMSEAEAARLLRALPNPGTGILDGDGPTAFKSKLDNAVQSLTLARMRYHFLRSGGWNQSMMSAEDIAKMMQGGQPPITLPQMRGIYNRRVQKLEQSFLQQNPRSSRQDIRAQAIAQARQEFGI